MLSDKNFEAWRRYLYGRLAMIEYEERTGETAKVPFVISENYFIEACGRLWTKHYSPRVKRLITRALSKYNKIKDFRWTLHEDLDEIEERMLEDYGGIIEIL